LRGVAPFGLVVVVGKGQVPKEFLLVAVVIGKTFRMMIVVVIVRGMICIRSLLMRLLLSE